MLIFIDANILFSASGRRFIRTLLDATLKFGTLVTNSHAWEEARTNLALKRPSQLMELSRLKKHIKLTSAFYKIRDIDLAEKDIPIISGAVGSKCGYLWTGDKRHFGKFYGKSIFGTTVVSSAMLAAILMQKGWNL